MLVPNADHAKYSVFVSEAAFGDVARNARAMGLGILAQVDSDPSQDTRHSDGDDDLVVMPFENMLSLVAPDYGRTLHSIVDFSIDQFQDHRWVLCERESILTAFDVASIS